MRAHLFGKCNKIFFTIYDYIPTSTFPKKKSFLTASFPSQMFDMKNKMKSGIIKLKFKTISTQSENTHFSTSKAPFNFMSLYALHYNLISYKRNT